MGTKSFTVDLITDGEKVEIASPMLSLHGEVLRIVAGDVDLHLDLVAVELLREILD